MSQRKATIEGFKRAMKDRWEENQIDEAAFLERQVTKFENMTDEDFNMIYLDGEKVLEYGE